MLIRDENLQARHSFTTGLERNRELVDQATEYALRDAALTNEVINNPTKAGKWLETVEFERRLKKLLPEIRFERHPHKKDKRICYLRPNTQDEFIVYEWPRIPERSVREVIRHKRTLPGLFGTNKPPISKADLPPHEVIPHVFNSDGSIKEFGRIVWGSDLRAGQVYEDIPGAEVFRGWRTVLARLRASGYLNPDQIEKEFGGQDTKEWAKHMGKQDTRVPW